jgi:hypothetical protein
MVGMEESKVVKKNNTNETITRAKHRICLRINYEYIAQVSR